MSLIRGLFWLVLFVFFTFCFVVLFEYGTHDFANGFKTEFEHAKTWVVEKVKPEEKEEVTFIRVSRAQLFVEHRGADDQPNAGDAGAHPFLGKFL